MKAPLLNAKASRTGLPACHFGAFCKVALSLLFFLPIATGQTRGASRPGANAIEIKVTNLWVNRIVGDQQAGAARKYTFTAAQFDNAQSPLLPSGLLGPVKVVRVEVR